MTDALFDIGTEERRSAVISPDGVYRYSLTREWDASLPRDLWIMCNPSDADHLINDPTVVRCRGFSTRHGSGAFDIGNAYAWRGSKPAAMWAAQRTGVDIIGPNNDVWLRTLCSDAERVILAWGAHPKPGRVAAVAALVRESGREPLCLGTTQDGQPRHPLMLANATELRPWEAS